MSKVSEIMQALRDKGALEKVAEAQGGLTSDDDERMTKLAEDLYAGGKIFGHAAVVGMLEKLAEQPVPATGQTPPSQGNEANDNSNFKRITEKVMKFKGIDSPGSTPSIPGGMPTVAAETTAPDQVAKPNPEEKTGA